MSRSSGRRARIAEAFRPKQATSGAIQYTARINDNKSILRTTAHQHSPDTPRHISVAEDHQVDFASDEESSYQASLDQVHELQLRLSASERKLSEIEVRYNQEYQALVAKIDDSITENTQHVVAREQMLTDYSTLERKYSEINKYTLNCQNELQQVKDERDRLVLEVQRVKVERDQFVPNLQQAREERDRLVPIVSALYQFGQCKICHSVMNQPTPLHCGHIFCCGCLQEWQNAQAEWLGTVTNKFPCPICRAITHRLKNKPIVGFSDLIEMATDVHEQRHASEPSTA